MRRRQFITLLGGAASWPLAARGQQTAKVPRVGVLWHAGNEQEEGVYFISLRQGFIDLVARNVAVLIAVSLPAAVAAKRDERCPDCLHCRA